MNAHTEIRTEITRLDRMAWESRNAAQLSAEDQARIHRAERRSAALAAALPETHMAQRQRNRDTARQRAKFERGHALFRRDQQIPLRDTEHALHTLSEQLLPPALDKQINSLLQEIERYTLEMTLFSPAGGLPVNLMRLLPLGEQIGLKTAY
jgi:uncharacterized iron-regulated membrane protein